MKIRVVKTGKVIDCTSGSWANICSRGKDSLFEIVTPDAPVTPIAVKREVVEVVVPPMPPLPEEKEIEETKPRRSKRDKKHE